MTQTSRLEVRVRADAKERLARAAEISHVPLSDFVRSAAEARAEQVLAEHDATTRVSPEYFQQLMDALDAPAIRNEALAQAVRRARELVDRD